jgi:hypothetical protein
MKIEKGKKGRKRKEGEDCSVFSVQCSTSNICQTDASSIITSASSSRYLQGCLGCGILPEQEKSHNFPASQSMDTERKGHNNILTFPLFRLGQADTHLDFATSWR